MKTYIKLTIFFFSFLTITTQAIALDYLYNGVIGKHRFTYNFPSNWYARTIGDKVQGFTSSLLNSNLEFEILEFENQSIKQVTNYFVDEETEFSHYEDKIFYAKNEDLYIKIAIYKDKKISKDFAKTFIKRGNTILATTTPNLSADNFPFNKTTNDLVKKIYNSFSFNDSWKHYIDSENQFTFTYPEKFILSKTKTNLETKLALTDPKSKTDFFISFVFPKTSVQDSLKKIILPNEKLDMQINETIYGIENSIKALFVNLTNGKKQTFYAFPFSSSSYVFSGENTESSYPRSAYLNDYLKEILESLEFVNIEEEYFPYLVFRDVRNNNENEKAINYLANSGIIQGYPDKTFKPDNSINRAELTKMIVESIYKGDLSKFKDCFPDVKDEWFSGYVCYAKDKGWVSGYADGKFKPANNINRAEALKITYEALVQNSFNNEKINNDIYEDIKENDWFYDYFTYFANRNLLDLKHIEEKEDKGTFYKIGNDFTRKELAETIFRMKLF